ncbi:hypothetical protein BN938_0751 [Mucinivorans hirudinis]|uniref:Uncharacterized protein n=1 Tax=Mucinivorans hirudinis TaxID=1433126 RepID=A0A060R6V5_9BACT|nr:hypothetical protein BN938_0751 [Mucinivorans hirudinis]
MLLPLREKYVCSFFIFLKIIAKVELIMGFSQKNGKFNKKSYC